jgi:Alginate lyase.
MTGSSDQSRPSLVEITRRAFVAGAPALVLCRAEAQAPELRDPFRFQVDRWERIRELRIRVPRNRACRSIPPPLKGFVGTSYYSDRDRSIVDPERLSLWEEQREPLLTFTVGVEKQVSIWLTSIGTHEGSLRCAVRWLVAWARSDALAGDFNDQSFAALRWCTTGLANAYLNIRGSRHLQGSERAEIDQWFAALAARCRESVGSHENNHLYWAAAAVAAASVAGNDRSLFEWAVSAAQRGIRAISDDGALPMELKRGGRALGYHCFSLCALLTVAEYAHWNGVNLYEQDNSALARLVDFVLRNVHNPTELEHMTGVKQEWSGLSDGAFGWAEMWQSRFPDGRLTPILAQLRPVTMAYLGGNQTLMFGRA